MNRLTTTILWLCIRLGSGIKMKGVQCGAGSLSTVDHTEVKCDYILWKQEQLYSIKWAVQYPGVKTGFLHYWNDGRKEFPSNGIVDVDRDYVDNKKARIRVSSDFEDENLEVCCEVNVLHDDGYGSSSARKRSTCSSYTVERGQSPRSRPLLLNLLTSRDVAMPGEQVEIECGVWDSHPSQSPPPVFNIKVAGQSVRGWNTRDGNKRKARPTLTEDHFNSARRGSGRRDSNSDSVTVECEASVSGVLVASINKTIQRTPEVSTRPSLIYSEDLSRPPRVTGNTASRHILVETKHSSGSILIGDVPEDVEEIITPLRTYSRTRLEISDEPVRVLDILGTAGYKVVAMGNTPDNRIVWTLAKTYIVDEL